MTAESLRQPLQGPHFAKQEQDLPVVNISRTATTRRKVTAFSWATNGIKPITVTMTSHADELTLTWGTSTIMVPVR